MGPIQEVVMRKKLRDYKSRLSVSILKLINTIAVSTHFKKVEIAGVENIPRKGAYLLVANHVSRWDGLVIAKLVGRMSNWMVSPNELKGVQGILLRGGGAFPADPRFDILAHIKTQAGKGEPIVIFPEGNLFRDGFTHPFKNGAARAALSCAEAGIDMPVVPAAINFSENGKVAHVLIAPPITVESYLSDYKLEPNCAIRNLTVSLYREVCHLRAALGVVRDRNAVLSTVPVRQWAPRIDGSEVA